jgi:hypothetical protein
VFDSNPKDSVRVDPHRESDRRAEQEERNKLAADPALDARGRALVLDPGVKLADARELVAIARRMTTAYGPAKGSAASAMLARAEGALDPENDAQDMARIAGSVRFEAGEHIHTPWSTTFSPPVAVRR